MNCRFWWQCCCCCSISKFFDLVKLRRASFTVLYTFIITTVKCLITIWKLSSAEFVCCEWTPKETRGMKCWLEAKGEEEVKRRDASAAFSSLPPPEVPSDAEQLFANALRLPLIKSRTWEEGVKQHLLLPPPLHKLSPFSPSSFLPVVCQWSRESEESFSLSFQLLLMAKMGN